VMWSHTERRMLLTVPCGGGHRSWDWMLEGCTLKFIYLKDKIVHMYTCKTDELMKPVMQVRKLIILFITFFNWLLQSLSDLGLP
jgi:hypothetical protein